MNDLQVHWWPIVAAALGEAKDSSLEGKLIRIGCIVHAIARKVPSRLRKAYTWATSDAVQPF